MLLGMQGLGKPGVNQAKMIEWGVFDVMRADVNTSAVSVLTDILRRLHGWLLPTDDQPPIVHPQDA